MGRTQEAEKVVLEILQHEKEAGPKSKEVIKKCVKKKHLNLEKKYLKKALKKLRGKGEIVKIGKEYGLASISSSTSTTASIAEENFSITSTNNSKHNEDEAGDDIKEELVPIAEKLRQNAKTDRQKKEKRYVSFAADPDKEVVIDIDDEIKRLEMELEQESDSEIALDDETETSDQQIDAARTFVLSLSKYADDHVETLPSSFLPLPGRYDPTETKKKSKSKNTTNSGDDGDSNNNGCGSGLRSAVKDLLDGYKARSAERLPFYCRFCSKQYTNEKDFFDHKSTVFHINAVELERKASFCRLCRRQLTSPAQMKEHLRSRPHKDCLRKRQEKTGKISNHKQQHGGHLQSGRRRDFQPTNNYTNRRRQWG